MASVHIPTHSILGVYHQRQDVKEERGQEGRERRNINLLVKKENGNRAEKGTGENAHRTSVCRQVRTAMSCPWTLSEDTQNHPLPCISQVMNDEQCLQNSEINKAQKPYQMPYQGEAKQKLPPLSLIDVHFYLYCRCSWGECKGKQHQAHSRHSISR